jgi:hypothetical protein
MCARIQTIQVSDEPPEPLPRPHSSRIGRQHRAPSITQTRRALIQAEFTAPRCALSFNGSAPTSGTPSIKPIHAPSFKASRSPHDVQRPQSSNQAIPVDASPATLAPSFRSPSRNALIQAIQVASHHPFKPLRAPLRNTLKRSRLRKIPKALSREVAFFLASRLDSGRCSGFQFGLFMDCSWLG